LNFAIGLLIALGCILGGYAALGGHLEVLMQPSSTAIFVSDLRPLLRSQRIMSVRLQRGCNKWSGSGPFGTPFPPSRDRSRRGEPKLGPQ
jgi:hypothetical protein